MERPVLLLDIEPNRRSAAEVVQAGLRLPYLRCSTVSTRCSIEPPMIELRYVRRKKIKSGIVSTSKVLQVRQINWGADITGAVNVAGAEWSDWQDVPTIDEPSDEVSSDAPGRSSKGGS